MCEKHRAIILPCFVAAFLAAAVAAGLLAPNRHTFFLLIGGILALYFVVLAVLTGDFLFANRSLEKERHERESSRRMGDAAQAAVLARLRELGIEPDVFPWGQVYWYGTALMLRKLAATSDLPEAQRAEGGILAGECEVLDKNPHVTPLTVRPPERQTTAEPLSDILARHGRRVE